MGLSEILQAMERRAKQQVAEREAVADAESHAVIEAAEAAAKEIKDRQRTEAMAKFRLEQARLFGAARLDRQRQLAAAREHWLGQVQNRARQLLAELRDRPHYARGFERLCLEAMGEFAATVKFEIDPRDERLMRRTMALLGVDGEIVSSLNTAGGVRVSSGDGRISVDNTVEARLENGWRALRQRLVVWLTAEEFSCRATMVTPTRASVP